MRLRLSATARASSPWIARPFPRDSFPTDPGRPAAARWCGPRKPRSRWLLVRELLGCASTKEAIDRATRELDAKRYAGCNIVCGDGDRLVVFQAGDWLRIRPLPPGLHLLSNDDVNDERDPRLTYALDLLQRNTYQKADDCVMALRQRLGLHEPDRPPISLRYTDRGTVSSSILLIRSQLRESTYLHAQGPPDQTPYADYSDLLKQLNTG